MFVRVRLAVLFALSLHLAFTTVADADQDGFPARSRCEARRGGRCFYISAMSGSDTNIGTAAEPWKTARNIVSYYSDEERPPNWVELRGGDVVYFHSGVYSETYDYNGQLKTIFLRGIAASRARPLTLKAYPGAHPVIVPDGEAPGIEILQSSGVVIDGFEVFRSFQAGINVVEGGKHRITNSWIHETYGSDNSNIAGLHLLGVAGIEVHHNRIHDNYDRSADDTGGIKTQNSRNVVIFGGGNVKIHHNVIFQSPPITARLTGGCITYKHAATIKRSRFEVAHNTLWNCFDTAIGSGTFGTRIHHNLIIASDPIAFRDFGGPTIHHDNIVERNTIVDGPALAYDPTQDYAPIGKLSFRKNVVVDSGSYGLERGIVTVGTYKGDDVYESTVERGKLDFRRNCYFGKQQLPLFSLFAVNGGDRGTKGGLFDLGGWQSHGLDRDSRIVDPGLSPPHAPVARHCPGAGARAR